MGKCFLYNIDTCFLIIIVWQMLCLIVSLAGVIARQMLFVFWNVADVIAKRKMLSSLFIVMADVIAIFIVEDVIPLIIMLQHIALADVIAKWQME